VILKPLFGMQNAKINSLRDFLKKEKSDSLRMEPFKRIRIFSNFFVRIVSNSDNKYERISIYKLDSYAKVKMSG
jgi:hypothetical protein